MTEINKAKLAFQFVLKWEGGYVNNPSDPGGETKYGISKRYHPDLDIKNLTPEAALEIYIQEYWNPIGGDNLPIPYCIAAMDSAVNCGVGRTNFWMRQAGNNWRNLINLRKSFYLAKTNSPFLRGWLNRLADLVKYCEQLSDVDNEGSRPVKT